jgi:glycosyltransferase involved in cell wall biosynthesis
VCRLRIGLLTEGGYPYATGESRLWCDRLVRGLAQHEFDVYALSRTADQEARGLLALPPQVRQVRTAPLWTPGDDGPAQGRRERRRFAGHFRELAEAVCGEGEDFAAGLYGLAELAVEHGGLSGALRSEAAVRILESAGRTPGANRTVQAARVPDHLAFADLLERALRPLSLGDWYDADSLGAVDLCHATSGGSAAIPGLLARRFFGVPLVVTEYGIALRTHYLDLASDQVAAPVRALFTSFHRRLAAEVYQQATVVTPGNTHARRWQEKCGADRAKLRTVYPGMEAGRFEAVGDAEEPGEPGTLVWVGRIDPSKDLIALLHAFAEVRREEPGARLRIVGAPAQGPEGAAYLSHCRALAAQLFPDEADGRHAVGSNPVSFEGIGGPETPDLAAAYASAAVVVLSSVVEGFPISLVEAMFCGRATVSTDVGAVVEVIGGTGLVVPPRNPRALGDACVALLRDPERRRRLGAAARERALELFTVEQNLTAFNGIYLDVMSHCPVRREGGDRQLFANPPESYVAAWAGADR